MESSPLPSSPEPEIPPASIETNPSDPESHLGGRPDPAFHRPAGRSAPKGAGQPGDVPGGARRVTPPPVCIWPRCPSSVCSPPGLSSLQALRHCRRLFCEGRIQTGRRGSDNVRPPRRPQILRASLFWKEAPAVPAPRGGCQGIRRPGPGVPNPRGAVVPAPSLPSLGTTTPTRAGPAGRVTCWPPGETRCSRQESG